MKRADRSSRAAATCWSAGHAPFERLPPFFGHGVVEPGELERAHQVERALPFISAVLRVGRKLDPFLNAFLHHLGRVGEPQQPRDLVHLQAGDLGTLRRGAQRGLELAQLDQAERRIQRRNVGAK